MSPPSTWRPRQTALAQFAEILAETRGVREVLDVGLAEFGDKWGAQRAFAVSWSSDQIELITGGLSWMALGADIRAAIIAARRTGCLQTSADLPGVAVPVETGARPVALWLDLDRRGPPSGGRR